MAPGLLVLCDWSPFGVAFSVTVGSAVFSRASLERLVF
ncbi:hypothetical protein THTE_2035 [Thermogutta terrifontis]|uniref:Uncharacterized protein n=1 Tax=Thermogutta terrifontis TaxID=1331910 RepID=A0A286RFC0_9BACT|nr:hypothetical protein THTE_2035 [Thermogutta terrifontis]